MDFRNTLLPEGSCGLYQGCTGGRDIVEQDHFLRHAPALQTTPRYERSAQVGTSGCAIKFGLIRALAFALQQSLKPMPALLGQPFGQEMRQIPILQSTLS